MGLGNALTEFSNAGAGRPYWVGFQYTSADGNTTNQVCVPLTKDLSLPTAWEWPGIAEAGPTGGIHGMVDAFIVQLINEQKLPVRSQPGAGVYPRRVWMHNSNQRLVTATCDYAASHQTFGRKRRSEGCETKRSPLVERVVTTAGSQALLPQNTIRGSARGPLVNERWAGLRTSCANRSSRMHGPIPNTSQKSAGSAETATTCTPIHSKANESKATVESSPVHRQ